jgi:hypothetical protein
VDQGVDDVVEAYADAEVGEARGERGLSSYFQESPRSEFWEVATMVDR